MAETYEGGCHCGAVRFSCEADLSTVLECNCSHCSKKGFLLVFVPQQQFRLTSGESGGRSGRRLPTAGAWRIRAVP